MYTAGEGFFDQLCSRQPSLLHCTFPGGRIEVLNFCKILPVKTSEGVHDLNGSALVIVHDDGAHEAVVPLCCSSRRETLGYVSSMLSK
jgi:hypothetical protein